MIAKWKGHAKCLKGHDKILVKKFYLRAMCQAYKMTSFSELCQFFQALFIVALSQYVGCDENGEQLPSEMHLQYLNNIIKCAPESAYEVLDDQNENLDRNETDNSDWFEWSAKIYDNAQQIAVNCIGITMNACYNPDFAAEVKSRLMPYVAIWSGVMRPHFKIGEEIATSTSVEGEFSEIKNRAFKGLLPMKADKFI